MSVKNEFEKYQEFEKYYPKNDPSHNWSHIVRVIDLCSKLSADLEIDYKVLTPAAVLHDIVNIPKNSIHRENASKLAAEKAKKLLQNFSFTQNELENISQIILEHSYSANLKASSIESEILQDADKLDSMGAIGIMRWCTVGSKMNASYYHPHDPLAKNRELNDKLFSLDHFETKLLKLYQRLNTERAKIEGQKRLQFMKSFLEQLKSEIPVF